MGLAKITQAEFERRALEAHGEDYKVIGVYQKIGAPIEIKHVSCGKVFTPRAGDFLGSGKRLGTKCPDCSHNSKPYTTTQIQIKVKSITNNTYEFIDTYTDTHSLKKFLHKECGNEFLMRPNNFLVKGNRCPNCKESKGEIAVEKWLLKNNFNFIKQYKPGKDLIGSNFISYDFAITDFESLILIEFDGRHHFEAFSKSNKSVKKFNERIRVDKLKDKYAKTNGLWLIRIPYWKLKETSEVLDMVFNDYLLSESTSQTIGDGNIDLSDYLVNLKR